MRVLDRRVLAIAFCVLGLAARVSAQAQIAVNGGTGPDPVSVAAGTTISVAVSGGPGNTTDWVALYARWCRRRRVPVLAVSQWHGESAGKRA